jgi:hypothetical protein
MKYRVSRATWTPIRSDRGQNFRMIVDNFQVAAEWRSRCRAGLVNTIAMTMNPPREPGYTGASPLASIIWSKRIPCPKKKNGRRRCSSGQLSGDCHCVRCPARQCLSRRSTARRAIDPTSLSTRPWKRKVMSFCRSRGRPRLGGPGNRDLEDRKSVKPSTHRGRARRVGGDHHRLRGYVHDGLESLDFLIGIRS